MGTIRSGVRLTFWLVCCCCAFSAFAQQQHETPASRAFKLFKTLEGKWKATTAQGAAAYLHYEVVSNGSALHERFVDEGNQQHSNLVTLYHLNKDYLEAEHFCSMNNQPFLRATVDPTKPREITFLAYQVSNLKTPGSPHMYKVSYKFTSDNRMTTIWTMKRDGKDVFVETLHWKRES